MKKIVVFLIIILSFFNTYATSGPVKQNSIIECNGTYYGKHGTPAHWHVVEKKNDKWVSVGEEVELPPCYIKELNQKEKVSFYKCSDGDTAWFTINGENKKTRFLAIDTLEIDSEVELEKKYAKEASEYTCNALKKAKEIYLEYDSNSDKEDKYGRILAFIHVDGELLQKTLIQKGLAKVAYIYGDYEYVDELREMEELAKKNKIGIWSGEIELPDEPSEESNDEEKELEEDIVIRIIKLIIQFLEKIFDLLFD